MTSGSADSMMMVCGTDSAATAPVAGSVLTTCCSVDLRLPAACALLRRRCTDPITSSGWARKASPSFCTQAASWLSVSNTCGKATSDCTLGSQDWFSTCYTASSPLASLCCLDHLAASATSPG